MKVKPLSCKTEMADLMQMYEDIPEAMRVIGIRI
jgi:hypothetical protein